MSTRLTYAEFHQDLLKALPAAAQATELSVHRALQELVGQRWSGAGSRGEGADAIQFMQARPQMLAQALVRQWTRLLDEQWRQTPAAPDHGLRDRAPEPELSLSLMDEQEVEQGIEQVRIERLVEQGAEWTLRELRGLCGGLPDRGQVEPEQAFPLGPAVAAEGLTHAVNDLTNANALRLTLMRAAAAGLARAMGDLYDEQLQALQEAGVTPAPLRIRSLMAGSPSVVPGRAPAAAADAAGAGWDPTRTLAGFRFGDAPHAAAPAREAIGQILGAAGPAAAAAASATPSVALTSGGLSAATGEQLAQLLQILSRQSQSGPAMQAIWDRLLEPVQRLGPTELTALQQPDHPFWRLLDRIAALSSVQSQSDPEMRELAARIEPVLAELERSATPSTAAFDTALVGLETLPAELGGPSEAVASELDLEARRRQIEPTVKGQLVWQLRPLGLPPVLNQFLLGPWVQVLTQALARHGAEAPQTNRYMNLVADLLAAVSQQRRGTRLSLREQAPLLSVAREGMLAGNLPPHLVQGYLDDLSEALSAAPAAAPAEPDTSVPAQPDFLDSQPVAQAAFADSKAEEWAGHAELATVPMAYGKDTEQVRAEREAWLATLAPGSLCRLMLQGRWVTALLSWQSENGMFYMFKSRHGSGTHTLTRRALERMRSEGLATTIEPGQLLARALTALRDQRGA